MDAAAALREADALHLGKQYDAAAVAYRRALSADPELLQAWYGLGCACASQYAYGDAIAALRRVVAARPDAAGARCTLAEALFQLGETDAAVAEYRLAAESGDPQARTVALAAIACIAPGCPGLGHAAVRSARQDWAASIGDGIRPLPPLRQRAEGKLRVGYVSAHFGARNWMKPVWGVINRHDRDRFEIHLLADGADPSADSGYVDHAEDHVWRIASLSNAELARRVREAALDVLVDLSGYSRQGRLALFLHRPAPRQLTWFNMYASSGLSCFDALVGDAAVVTQAEEAAYSEPIVKVPGTYLAFEVLYPVPEVAPPPVLRNRLLTFGSFASAHKITDGVVAAWARILLGAPSARLLAAQPDPARCIEPAGFDTPALPPEGSRPTVWCCRAVPNTSNSCAATTKWTSRWTPPRKRWHHHDRGAVAGRSCAELQRRPLGQPYQPLAAAGGRPGGLGRGERAGICGARHRAGTARGHACGIDANAPGNAFPAARERCL